MKPNHSMFMILLIIVLINCSGYRKQLSENGTKNQAIENAIIDFVKTNKLLKKYSVFEIKVYNPLYKKKLTMISENIKKWENDYAYNDLIVVNIFGSDFKNRYLSNDVDNENKRIPSKYIEMENKLFIWNDNSASANNQTIQVLKKYRIITDGKLDSMKVIDDSKKGTDYYFCKRNLKIYKKVTTNIATGYYQIPKINCK